MTLPQRHELSELPPPFFWSDDLNISVIRKYKTKPCELIKITTFPVQVVKFLRQEGPDYRPVVRLRQYYPHDEPIEINIKLTSQSSFIRKCAGYGVMIQAFKDPWFYRYVLAEFEYAIESESKV